MPSQIFIIPPKKPRARKVLTATSSDKSPRNVNDSQSVPVTPIGDDLIGSSENKLGVNKLVPSVRISPPQPIVDGNLDWDDEDRHFGRLPTFNRRRRGQQYHEQLARIREGEPEQNAAVSALVSAPILEPPGGQTTSGNTEYPINLTSVTRREGSVDNDDLQGQTLLHLAARLGHEEIMRMLITETSHASILLNTRGQTPLLCAIEAGSTSTATILMEQDPLSLTCKDCIGSSVFHYATEQCNDIVLSRAISLLKRLSSSAARMTVSENDEQQSTTIGSVTLLFFSPSGSSTIDREEC